MNQIDLINEPSQTNPSPHSILRSTLAGIFWMFSGTGLQAVLQGIMLVVLVRLLTPKDFGLIGGALVVVGFSELLYQLGIGPTIVQRSHLEERHIRTGFTLSLLFGFLLAGFISFIAPTIADLLRMEQLTSVLRVISLVFVLRSVSVIAQSTLQRELKFRLLAGIQVISYVLGYGVVGVLLALLGFGVWALVVAHLVKAALNSTILLFVQPHPKLPQLELRSFNELMYFGGGFTLARIGNYIALQGDNLVVARWLGAEALGFYGRAYQLMALPATLFGQVLDRVLFPAMAKLQNNPEQLAKAYKRGVSLIALLVLPTSVAILVLAPEIIYVLLGPGWSEVVPPFQILTISILFRSSYKMSHSLARATGAVYSSAWRQAIYAVLIIAAAWIGKHWGISGVALGVFGAITVNFILMTQLSLTLIPVTWRTFLSAHVPALSLTGIIFVETWSLASVMRYAAIPALSLLVTWVGVTGFTLWVLVRLTPKRVLGRDGVWMLENVVNYLHQKSNCFTWFSSRLGFMRR